MTLSALPFVHHACFLLYSLTLITDWLIDLFIDDWLIHLLNYVAIISIYVFITWRLVNLLTYLLIYLLGIYNNISVYFFVRCQEPSQSTGDGWAAKFKWKRRGRHVWKRSSTAVDHEWRQYWRSSLGQWGSGVVGKLSEWGQWMNCPRVPSLLHIHDGYLHIHVEYLHIDIWLHIHNE